ncbi:hypothetical protein [Rhizobium sp. SU303]|uniref:hypothetical protein n=1 Tax=Rhizobium sp. SU303 TaxID=3138065 RepID=UPI001E342804|nr:hypothetical protein [Rhizobium leguminosarum]UFW80035.1 hypothetical protein RlegSU303_08985 [Rhizobium leguminosarum bv. viciae]
MVDLSYFHGVKADESGEALSFSLGLLTSPELRDKFGQGFEVDTPSAIDLSTSSVSERAGAGTIIGRFSVVDDSEGGWSYALADDADGMFAISGDWLLVGSTPLSHDDAPTPVITVKAARGARLLAATIQVSVEPTAAPPVGRSLDFSSTQNSYFIGQVI